MASIATEISFLLQWGFADGAAARSRTLYELVIKALLIAKDESASGFELAERYYISARLERGADRVDSDERHQEVLRRARSRWGSSFFGGDNNWAIPAMGRNFRKTRVTFKDLEDAAKTDDLRHMYIECNEAVHAGALRIVQNADFRQNYPHRTQGEVDPWVTGRVGQATAYYLELGTHMIVECFARELTDWDYMLHATAFMSNVRLANKLFWEGCERLRD